MIAEFLLKYWEWIVLAMYVAEKIVKLTPSKHDDIIVDMIIKTILRFINPVEDIVEEIEKDVESREG